MTATEKAATAATKTTKTRGRPRKTATRTRKTTAAAKQTPKQQPTQEEQQLEQQQQPQEDTLERKYNNARQQLAALEQQLEQIEASFSEKAAEIAAASEMISASDYGESMAFEQLTRAQEAAKAARFELVISEGTADEATMRAHVERCEQHVQTCEQEYREEYAAAQEVRTAQEERAAAIQREQQELQQLRSVISKHRDDMRALATALFEQLGNKQADGVRAYLDDLTAQRESLRVQIDALDATIASEQRSIGNYLEPWPDLAQSVQATHGIRPVTQDAIAEIVTAWLDLAHILRQHGPQTPRFLGNIQFSELLAMPGNIIANLARPGYWQIRRTKDAQGQEVQDYTCQQVEILLSHVHRYRGL